MLRETFPDSHVIINCDDCSFKTHIKCDISLTNSEAEEFATNSARKLGWGILHDEDHNISLCPICWDKFVRKAKGKSNE
jgi:hypothetical protein